MLNLKGKRTRPALIAGLPPFKGVAEGRGIKDPRSPKGQGASLCMPLVAMFLMLLFPLTACRSHRQRMETLSMAQRQERQLTFSDTLWQQLSICFDNLVVEWLADSLPVEGSPPLMVRLKAARAEVSHEERSSATLAALVQHSDTVSQQQEEASVAGMAAVESQACRGDWTPRQRLWLWLLPWLILFLCAGFFLLKKRFGWPP